MIRKCMFKCEPYDDDEMTFEEHWNKNCKGNPEVSTSQEKSK